MGYPFFVPAKGETPSEQEWHQILLRGFPGKPDVAAGFLVQVQHGIDFVRKATRENGTVIAAIDIGISLPDPHSPPSFCYEYGPDMGVPKYGHVIMVPGELLVATSRVGRRTTTPNLGYDVTRDSVHDEFWFLDGVEEADHARFRQLSGKPNKKFTGRDTHSAEYDAQQHEFEALFMRLAAAKAKGMPQMSITAIETRIRLATLWRKEHATPSV